MAEAWLDNMIEEIRAKEIELNNLKRAANTFFRSKGEPEPFKLGDSDNGNGALQFRPDEFYGRSFSAAARLYLERRKQAVSGDDVTDGLEQGGFDFAAQGWKDENRARTVAMSLAKNSQIFHRLPNGLFGLKEWYPEAIERKKGKKNGAPEKETVEE
jgi:hypothetical protein